MKFLRWINSCHEQGLWKFHSKKNPFQNIFLLLPGNSMDFAKALSPLFCRTCLFHLTAFNTYHHARLLDTFYLKYEQMGESCPSDLLPIRTTVLLGKIFQGRKLVIHLEIMNANSMWEHWLSFHFYCVHSSLTRVCQFSFMPSSCEGSLQSLINF